MGCTIPWVFFLLGGMQLDVCAFMSLSFEGCVDLCVLASKSSPTTRVSNVYVPYYMISRFVIGLLILFSCAFPSPSCPLCTLRGFVLVWHGRFSLRYTCGGLLCQVVSYVQSLFSPALSCLRFHFRALSANVDFVSLQGGGGWVGWWAGGGGGSIWDDECEK